MERVWEDIDPSWHRTAPPVDVYENADELLLLADVPGATHDGIDVQLDKGQLTIWAKRREDSRGSMLAAEYRPYDYHRIFSVPQGIDASTLSSTVECCGYVYRSPRRSSRAASR